MENFKEIFKFFYLIVVLLTSSLFVFGFALAIIIGYLGFLFEPSANWSEMTPLAERWSQEFTIAGTLALVAFINEWCNERVTILGK